MEGLHPVNRGRRCIPNPKIGFEHPPGLASKRRTGSSAHIRVLLIVRTLEDAWSTMQKSGVGRRATSSPIGAIRDPANRRGSSNRRWSRNTNKLCYTTNSASKDSAGQSRTTVAKSNSHKRNVVRKKRRRPSLFPLTSQVVGEVGLVWVLIFDVISNIEPVRRQLDIRISDN